MGIEPRFSARPSGVCAATGTGTITIATAASFMAQESERGPYDSSLFLVIRGRERQA